MTTQYTAMISFKLLTSCKTLLNGICRRPATVRGFSDHQDKKKDISGLMLNSF